MGDTTIITNAIVAIPRSSGLIPISFLKKKYARMPKLREMPQSAKKFQKPCASCEAPPRHRCPSRLRGGTSRKSPSACSRSLSCILRCQDHDRDEEPKYHASGNQEEVNSAKKAPDAMSSVTRELSLRSLLFLAFHQRKRKFAVKLYYLTLRIVYIAYTMVRMECEICGRETETVYEVNVDGAKMLACEGARRARAYR